MKWGFAPAWISPGRAPPPINARAETVATNGLFKTSLSRYRCIVPATGFFEWRAIAGEKRKAPHHRDPGSSLRAVVTRPVMRCARGRASCSWPPGQGGRLSNTGPGLVRPGPLLDR
jgi:hypothetical protein